MTIGRIDHGSPALAATITRYGQEHRGSTMAFKDPRAGVYIVRKTAYDAWRVFNVVTKEWVGNAVEDESTAKGIARRLERGE